MNQVKFYFLCFILSFCQLDFVNSGLQCLAFLSDFKMCMTTCKETNYTYVLVLPRSQNTLQNAFTFDQVYINMSFSTTKDKIYFLFL